MCHKCFMKISVRILLLFKVNDAVVVRNNVLCCTFSYYIVCLFLWQTSETTEQTDSGKDKEESVENDKDSKVKKDNGAPPKKKKQQVKTIDLRVESSVPALKQSELQEAIEKEVCSLRLITVQCT